MTDDFASILFPNDAPPPANQEQRAAVPQAPASQAAQGQTDAQPHAEDDAGKTANPDLPSNGADLGGAVERLDSLADAIRINEPERAAALTSAVDQLVSEAISLDMPASELNEIVGYLHEASGTLSPVSAEQLADLNAKCMRELTDVPPADLDAARAMIQHMDKRIPGTIRQLEATGLGSDANFVRAVIRAARRAGR